MMAKKSMELAEEYKEFGVSFKDEEGVFLVLESNAGKDKHKYLEEAKKSKMKRPILLSVESDIFDSYKFKNYALTIDEARLLVKELSRMIDYIED